MVTIDDVKARLNKSLGVDDGELQAMLDAAVAEYETTVGPLATVVRTNRVVRGGIFPEFPVISVTSAADLSGAALNLTDLDTDALASGLFRDIYGRSYSTARVTYTAGHTSVPANVREVIAADVAGYFAATQRGAGGPLPGPAGGFYEEGGTSVPLDPFPRIHALARTVVA